MAKKIVPKHEHKWVVSYDPSQHDMDNSGISAECVNSNCGKILTPEEIQIILNTFYK